MRFATFLLSQNQTAPLSDTTEDSLTPYLLLCHKHIMMKVSKRLLFTVKHLRCPRADFSQMCCPSHVLLRFCKALTTVLL